MTKQVKSVIKAWLLQAIESESTVTVREFLSNFLFELAAIGAVAAIIWSYLVGPRLKGRLAYNWVLRRAAEAVPDARVENQGSWWRKKLKVTWPTQLSFGETTRPVQLEAAISVFAPWDIRLRMSDGGDERPALIVTYRWSQWPHDGHAVECSGRSQMLDALICAVRLHRHFQICREFQTPLALARASHAGFPGLDVPNITSS